MESLTDPFTLVFNGFWAMVRRNKRLMQLVRPGNQVDFDKSSDQKDAKSTKDYPELSLWVRGGNADYANSSSTSSVTRIYSWVLNTGDFRINEGLNPITWELYRSLVDWDTILCSLFWPDNTSPTHNFVRKTTVINMTEGLDQDLMSGKYRGWSAVWACELIMFFDTETLRLNDSEIL